MKALSGHLSHKVTRRNYTTWRGSFEEKHELTKVSTREAISSGVEQHANTQQETRNLLIRSSKVGAVSKELLIYSFYEVRNLKSGS